MWAGLSTMNGSALKKERYSTSSWRRLIFELCVMLISQDQGQPPTTALDREFYMGNIYDSANGTRDTTCKDRPEECVSFITYIPRRLWLRRYQVWWQILFWQMLAFWLQDFLCSFQQIQHILRWLVRKKSNNQNIIHYLDDFLLVGKARYPCCWHALDTFHQVCAQLGVPIAKDKTVEPTTRLTFLGIEFDTVGMTLRLPQDKLTELQRRIQETLHISKTTLRDLQSGYWILLVRWWHQVGPLSGDSSMPL